MAKTSILSIFQRPPKKLSHIMFSGELMSYEGERSSPWLPRRCTLVKRTNKFTILHNRVTHTGRRLSTYKHRALLLMFIHTRAAKHSTKHSRLMMSEGLSCRLMSALLGCERARRIESGQVASCAFLAECLNPDFDVWQSMQPQN